MRYGIIFPETTTDGHPIITGPFTLRAVAEAVSYGNPVVEWQEESPCPSSPCELCGETFVRLDMPKDTTKVYDALFPAVLNWHETDDCGMAEMMRAVAEAAASAVRVKAVIATGSDVNRDY